MGFFKKFVRKVAPVAATAAPFISPGMGSIIGAGIGLAGGLIGGNQDRRNQANQNKREDTRFQRASIDAKAAGLHPLFALGAAGAGSPQFLAGQSETGSKLGDVLKGVGRGVKDYSRATNPITAKMNQIGVLTAESNLRKSLIDEQLLTSELRRTTQTSTTEGADREYQIDRLDDSMRRITPGQDVRKQPEYQKISIPMPGGKRLIIGPSVTAEDIELIFGDIAGSVYGVAKAAESAYLTIMDEAKTKNWGQAGTQKTLNSLKSFVKRLRMDKAYKRITKTQAFKARVRSTQSTRKRIYP